MHLGAKRYSRLIQTHVQSMLDTSLHLTEIIYFTDSNQHSHFETEASYRCLVPRSQSLRGYILDWLKYLGRKGKVPNLLC